MDKTVAEIQDRMRDADEVAEAISSTNYTGVELDPVSIPDVYFVIDIVKLTPLG